MPSRSLLRSLLIPGLGLAVVGAVLCFVPLFNLLGFESSLALAAAASLFCVPVGVRAAAAPSLRAALGRAGAAALCLLPPLGLLLANGLRVRNCDYLAGLGFSLALPLPSALLASGLGLSCGLWLRRPRLGAYALLFVLSVLWTLWRVLATPAVFAYDPFFGFFPGSLYDEELTLSAAFYWARLHQLAWLAGALCVSAAAYDPAASPRCRWSALRGSVAVPGPRRRALAAGGCALAVALVVFLRRGELGFSRDAAEVQRTLSRERVTRHFVLRYAPGGGVARDIELYAREHELRYQQLAATLGVRPDWKTAGWLARLLDLSQRSGPDGPLLVSYLFESAGQKAALMGAAHTYIAKPWRREIYLQHEGWPHPVLKHELAHLFAGAAGDPLLRLSRRGLFPELALVEGLAVAADFRGGSLTVHQQARALRQAGLAPPPRALFGLAFWGQASTRAYTIAGSFCHYLLTRFGPARLLAVHRAGGTAAAFRAAYGQDLDALAKEWGAFADAQPLPPAERELERERARRPAVFYKVCARELALRRQRSREAAGRGDADEARRLLRAVCRDDPAEPRHLLDLSDLLYGLNLRAEAAAVAEELLRHPGASGVLRARAHERRADEAFLRGDLAAAAAEVDQALRLPSDEGQGRTLTVKRLLLQALAGEGAETAAADLLDPAPVAGAAALRRAAALLLRVLVPDPTPGKDSGLDALWFHQAMVLSPRAPLPRYLLGRQLHARGAFAEAAAELDKALALDKEAHGAAAAPLALPDDRFRTQARLLRGQALLRAGDVAKAAAVFRTLLDSQPESALGRRVELADWIDRAERAAATAADL